MGESFGLSNSYEYKELELDSLDADGSYIFGVDKTDWPVFTVAGKGPLEDVVAVKVLEAVFPFSWDVFNSSNNTFVVSEGGLTFTVTIPVGNYTSSAIATALTTALNGVGFLSTYTVTYSGLRNRLVFTSSTASPFTFTFGTGNNVPNSIPSSGNRNPRLYIGFPPGDTASTMISGGVQSITSPNSILLSGPNYVYINSVKLGSNTEVYLPGGAVNLGGGKAGSQICKVTVNCNANGTVTYQDPDPQKYFKYDQLSTLNSCDFYLTLGNTSAQTPLKLNGLSFSIKLGILVQVKNDVERVMPTFANGRVSRRDGPKRLKPTF